ncbi:hypothetical protein YOLOSWAG_45 [Erwinia phage vB_EamM_Yoloswag]|uniref:Uncharacterized protein n=1 Tax=Erwinia phage vB_EamM_Yoloswag TaxID=1958956 RepID=A0A1S6L2X6_9CAUD|nr:hypothetical protein HOR66_gp045 [Erwinia phage vB_EamM_Yoloswag]AQT28530.1 hypothetical protein YOLOSWAG_45 [Erwinia phage vB_EamM_Yoloswag]
MQSRLHPQMILLLIDSKYFQFTEERKPQHSKRQHDTYAGTET